MNNLQILKIFRGKNFMTPRPLSYYRAKVRGKVAYVELSEGESLDGGALYGVTFRRANGDELWREGKDNDPSGCFRSLTEARKLIDDYKRGTHLMPFKALDPKRIADDSAKFLVAYLKNNVIAIPKGCTDVEYDTAMDSVTKAMIASWGDGFLKGRES